MKKWTLVLLALSTLSAHAKSVTKRVVYIDMGTGRGTGYFIKASNQQCESGQERVHFITAGHVAFDIQSPEKIIPRKPTMDFVTNSSAGNPLEIFKAFAPVALGVGAAYSGVFTVGQVVTGMNVLSYAQMGGEVLGYLHYDMNGNSYDMELKNSKDHKTLGLFKRLATLKPTYGTYFRVGLKHFDVASCHDTIKMDVTESMNERSDVEYFRPAAALPEAGDKLSTLGFPGAAGRIVMKNCTYEGLNYFGGVKGANTDSLLHTMRCPTVVVPQGISGGPVLNAKGEVVGTVTRGAVFLKTEPHMRSDRTMLSAMEVADLDRQSVDMGRNLKEDYETIIHFAELTEKNIDCHGNLSLGYRNLQSLQTQNAGLIFGTFDQNSCLISKPSP